MRIRFVRLAGMLVCALVMRAEAMSAQATEKRDERLAATAVGAPQQGVAATTETMDRKPKKQRKKRYRDVAPKGVAGHAWGKPFMAFGRLKQAPVAAQIAYQGEVIKTELRCIATSTSECDFDWMVNSMNHTRTQDAFHLLAEFTVPDEGVRFKGSTITFYPVTYLFCAKWHGTKTTPPKGIENDLRLCGARMVFATQTAEQARQMSATQPTNYELVLDDLIRNFGEPYRFLRRPHVMIQSEDDAPAETRRRSFKAQRWCPPVGGAWVPSCETSIVMGVNPESGMGVVLYATTDIWEFARARDTNVRGHDPLYSFLYAH